MTRPQWIFLACAILTCVWLLINVTGSGSDTKAPIPIDDVVLADLNGFVRQLDQAPISDVRVSLATLARIDHEHHDRHADVFRHIVEHSRNTHVREASVVAWRRTGSMDQDTLMALARNHEDEALRIHAIREIDAQKMWDALPAVIDALNDSNVSVRIEAHEAVGHRLGLKHNYDAQSPPRERAPWITLYHQNWEAMRDLHEAEQRLQQKQDG